MLGFLLDTNHIGQAVMPNSVVRQRIIDMRLAGVRLGTCVPVLCEIEAGIQQVARPEMYRRNLERLLEQVRVWPIDRTTAHLFGVIHHDLKMRGRVLSQVDMMLAALARQMQVKIATADKDFITLPDIATENWLSG